MIFRRLTRATAADAAPLLEAQYREHDIPMSGAPLLRALRALFPDHGLLLVARDPQPVGLALLSWQHSVERGGRVGWLEELYVVPERRGQGLGRSLLVRAVAAARRAGCASVELEVVRGHERAARLYVREGFHRVPRARFSRRL